MSSLVPYKPSPTLYDFHFSDKFVRGVLGPFGSGKSVGMCWEIFFRCKQQAKGKDGLRRSRWAVVRNTQQQLKDTTLNTWLDWFPEGVTGHFRVSDMTYTLEYEDVRAEILFRPLDKPEDVKRLLSLELTGAWVNEAREVPKAIIDGLTGRVGRYPGKGGSECTWCGIIMDTNPPDEDHWWYRIFEVDMHSDPNIKEDYEIFKQPPAVYLDEKGKWQENPKAENLSNLKPGYYRRMVSGKDKEWVKVYAQGQYGIVSDGRPVYSGYNDDIHCKEFDVDPRLPVYVGWDYSVTGQACVVAQLSPRGQLRVFDEFVSDDSGLYQFIINTVKPGLAKHGVLRFQSSWGDPSGRKRGDLDEKSALELLNDSYQDMPVSLPFMTEPADTNALQPRIDAVNGYLNRLIDGKPAFLLHPRCSRLRKGFLGRYEFKRMQVVGDERYKDVPNKNQYSHCFVAGTLVSTPDGDRPIELIRVGDFVNTPLGPRAVTATMNSVADNLVSVNGIVCTGDHPFATPLGFVRADSIQYTTGYVYSEEKEWEGREFILYRISKGYVTTESLAGISSPITTRTAANTCIGRYGNTITAQSQKATTSTMSTMTKGITASKIWSALTRQAISGCTPLGVMRKVWRNFRIWLKSGTEALKAALGTPSTQSELLPPPQYSSMSALGVGNSTKQRRAHANEAFAHLAAKPQPEWHQESMTLTDLASIAGSHSGSTNTEQKSSALTHVDVLPVEGSARVYDITVDDAHAFYAGGMLVSNCQDALQYLCRSTMAEQIQEVEWNEGSHWDTKRNAVTGY